jgi:hypothetical protein
MSIPSCHYRLTKIALKKFIPLLNYSQNLLTFCNESFTGHFLPSSNVGRGGLAGEGWVGLAKMMQEKL